MDEGQAAEENKSGFDLNEHNGVNASHTEREREREREREVAFCLYRLLFCCNSAARFSSSDITMGTIRIAWTQPDRRWEEPNQQWTEALSHLPLVLVN